MIQIDERTFALAPLQPDEGFQYGRAVFETLPVYKKPVLFLEHISRLNRGLEALQIRKPVNPVWLEIELTKLQLENCVLKILVSEKNLVFQTRPLPADKANASLTLQPDWRSRHPLLLEHKTVQYMAGLLAWETACRDGYDDALLINPAGKVAESSRSNLFFVKNGQLHTPDLACGLLPGIVRAWVTGQYSVEAGFYTPENLFQAEGVFICSSVIGIRPVAAIDDQVLGQSSLILKIADHYRGAVSDPAK